MRLKNYSNVNVYDAAKARIQYIFDEFEQVAVSFSGGKDSGVVLNMAIDEARKRGRKIIVTFIDLEAFYSITIDYIKSMIEANMDVVEPMWICLPMKSPNGLSYFEPTWTWWDPEKKDIWVRSMPSDSINLSNHEFDFYYDGITFEDFVPAYNTWLGRNGTTAILLGLRADESLNRFRAVKMDKETYNGKQWTTKVSEGVYSCSPIYDWTVEDIWIYNGKYNKPYNKLYDLFYKAGVSIHKMRVDEPFGNEAKAGLNMFRIIEPKTWAKVANRVSGANFGNIYTGNKIMSANYTLPPGHTWKTFTKFLLATLPEDMAKHYKRKFIKFIKYWHRVGCPMRDEYVKELELNHNESIVNTHKYSVRGKGDKEVIKFNRILDAAPGIDNKDDVLTWRRMAMCIIKNDYVCKGLSFSMTKGMSERSNYLVEKYRSIL